MELIEDQRAVGIQAIACRVLQGDAGGHETDARFRASHVLEAHRVAHTLAKGLALLLGHPARQRPACHPSRFHDQHWLAGRLGAPNRNASRLAAPCGRAHNEVAARHQRCHAGAQLIHRQGIRLRMAAREGGFHASMIPQLGNSRGLAAPPGRAPSAGNPSRWGRRRARRSVDARASPVL